MSQFLHSLYVVEMLFFGTLGLVAVGQWWRHRGAASGWLAATFGTLAVIIVVGRMLPPNPPQEDLDIVKVLIALIVVFPYLLYRFKRSFAGTPRWLDVSATILTVTALATTPLLTRVPKGDPGFGWLGAFVLLVAVQWILVIGAVAVSLWRAGRGEPTLARRRMRTLGLGAAGLATALVLQAGSDPGSASHGVGVALIALGCGPLLFAGYVSPQSLKWSWRRHEGKELQAAIGTLMAATEPDEVIDGFLPTMAGIVGAKAAGIYDAEGNLLGARSLNGDPVAGAGDGEPPLRVGSLAIWASPYLPFFRREELELLKTLAALASMTLERCRFFEQERRSRLALENAHADLEDAQHIARIGSWRWDVAEGTVTWSAELYRLHGLDPATFQPTTDNLQELLHPEDREALSDAVRSAVVARSTFDLDFRIIQRSGEVRTLHARGKSSTGPGGSQQVIGTVQDVTDQRRLERLRTEFIANAAHELRTPLTTVAGMASLLAEHRGEMSEEETGATFDALGRQGERARVLIQNMLDLSRLEATPRSVALETVPLALAVKRALESVPEPSGISVAVDVPDHLAALAEEARLEQVLTNLLSNAYRYGGKHIRVEATSAAGRVLISVSDDGPGVPRELVDRMFEPFTRGQGMGAGVGSGLGLAISRRLVEAFHGSLTYEPRDPHGSRFTVALSAAG